MGENVSAADDNQRDEISSVMEQNEMGTLPVGRLLRKMSLPLIISMFVQVLYGLVDSMFVARIDGGLTAISLAMPVQYLVMGIGLGLGTGVNSVLSKKLGEGDMKGVSRTAGNGLLTVWLVMLVFLILGITVMEPFYRFQTDMVQIRNMSISYSVIICIFSFGTLHQVLFERLLSATGKANLSMISMLTGAIINIILDPILIFGLPGFPAMGIAGAAYATVFAQIAAAIVGLVLNLKYNQEIHFAKSGFLPNGGILKEIIKIGIPVALSNSLISVLALAMNNILLGLSILAPGIYVIYIRLQSFIIMPSGGMSSAGVSIIAYNYGAKNKSRIMDTLRISLGVNAIIAVIGMIIFLAVPQLLLAMFNASADELAIGVPALRIIAVALVFTTTTQIFMGFLQALGRGTESFAIAIAQAVILIAAAWLLSLTGSVILVWLAFPIMEVLRFGIGFFFVLKTHKRFIKRLEESK